MGSCNHGRKEGRRRTGGKRGSLKSLDLIIQMS
jgi:hypothetical protein